MEKIKANKIIAQAKKFLNVPFCHYGRSTIGLDCSGLIWIAHHRSNVHFARTDYNYNARWWQDSSQGERIIKGLEFAGFELCDDLMVGGIVLFRIYGKHVPVNHCGILINEHQFIHTKCGIRKMGNKVSIDALKPGYLKRLGGWMKHKDVDYEGN